ncbi:MAG: prepilin-type N-terminal cleavage/methylation domain-containing protein, partial [Nitrospirae bacterium]|nr:prepilin-type N-terminal cleavage/methylation domain-containing protein [Nitrospirota bacterium]
MNNKKGFTLTELIIVVAVIGILAAISIPAYLGVQKRAARAEAYTNLETLRQLEEQYFSENSAYTASLGTCAAGNNNISAIQAVLPGFQPGSSLSYSYCIQQNIDIYGTAQTPCFRVSAFGNSGTRVSG